MLRPSHLACAVALAIASSAAFAQTAPPTAQPSSHAGLFDHMVVFGDSLSDNGNLDLSCIAQGQCPQLPFLMRFTTNPGQTGVEAIANYFGVPMAASHSPPCSRIAGTFAYVSTLVISVGWPQRPLSDGYGGRARGVPRPPSIDAMRAVSSPQT